MKPVLAIVVGLFLLLGIAFLWLDPDLVTQPLVLGGAAGIIVLVVLLPRYETHFYGALVLAFVWAGTGVPFKTAGTVGRWPMLAAAAGFGVLLAIRKGRLRYEAFHLFALFGVVTAVASVAVSVNSSLAAPKAASLFLLFLYCAVGLRLSFTGREAKFVEKLVLICEGMVFVTGFLYFVAGNAFFGNTNSLGAVVAVLLFPVVLWGTLIANTQAVLMRRGAALLLAGILIFYSSSRASLMSAVVAGAVLLWALKQYRLLSYGLVALLLMVAGVEAFSPGRIDDMASGVIYKSDGNEHDLLQSRRSVWTKTVSIIESSPLLGNGFGTSIQSRNGTTTGEWGPVNSSKQEMEHGSSYLSLFAWLGLLGALPFVLMLGVLLLRMARVYGFLRRTGNVMHAAVPITAVLTAALVNVIFEDWLLAVGYYLTIIFWTFAFLLVDLVPSRGSSGDAARA